MSGARSRCNEGAGPHHAQGGRARPAGQGDRARARHARLRRRRQVRQGKVIDLELAETDPAGARAAVDAMCRKLLANTVIESYRIELES